MNILLTPVRIGPVEIPNRIVMPPMTTRTADADSARVPPCRDESPAPLRSRKRESRPMSDAVARLIEAARDQAGKLRQGARCGDDARAAATEQDAAR